MEKSKASIQTILIALLGVMLIGVGVAFNNCAGLGNDPVGIVYDGIRAFGGLDASQLDLASNIVNITLIILLLIIGRKYIRIGTFVYIIPYGLFVKLGTVIFQNINMEYTLINQIIFSVIGCLLLYFGVALYIVVDIGVDPFTGIVLVLRDKSKKAYRGVKIAFDISMIILGTILGGKLGAVTIITALTAGPCIQFFTENLEKILLKENRSECYGNTNTTY